MRKLSEVEDLTKSEMCGSCSDCKKCYLS